MAREAGLRIRLGGPAAAQEVHHRALAGARAADHRDVQGRRRLTIEIGHDDIANERSRQSQFAGSLGERRLRAAVAFEPSEIVGEILGQRAQRRGIHRADCSECRL